MSDFKFKMHQNRFRLGSAGALPQTPLGSLQRSPRPPSWNKGALLLREGEERGRKGKGEGNEREGRQEGEREGKEKAGKGGKEEEGKGAEGKERGGCRKREEKGGERKGREGRKGEERGKGRGKGNSPYQS